VGVSPSTVASVFADARSLGLNAAAVEALTDAELDARLYAKPPAACVRPEPDCAALHLELRRPGVTLALLHVEFLTAHPDGLRYSAFCDRYRAWSKRSSPVMRQVHVAGDKLFVDYAGMKPCIVDATTAGMRTIASEDRVRTRRMERRADEDLRACWLRRQIPSLVAPSSGTTAWPGRRRSPTERSTSRRAQLIARGGITPRARRCTSPERMYQTVQVAGKPAKLSCP
jgi:hypothetical protein